MSEPTTVRGRDMVARYALSQPDPADLSRFTYDIARIEAEAARDALTAAVRDDFDRWMVSEGQPDFRESIERRLRGWTE